MRCFGSNICIFWKHYHFKQCVTYPNTHFYSALVRMRLFWNYNFFFGCVWLYICLTYNTSIFIYTPFTHKYSVFEMFKYFSGLFFICMYGQRSFKLLRRVGRISTYLYINIYLYTRRHNLFNVAIILCIDSNGFSVIVFFNVV